MILLIFACHHPGPPAPPAPPAWDGREGLQAPGPAAPSVVVVPQDKVAWGAFAGIDADGAFASDRAAEELGIAERGASQVWFAAAAGAEVSAGLLYGQVGFAELGCANAARVDDPTLYRLGGLEDVLDACSVLHAARAGDPGTCAEVDALARDAWAHLAQGDEPGARSRMGEAVVRWRHCPDAHAVWAAPPDPASLGFVTVLAAQILRVDDALYFRGSREMPALSPQVDQRWRALVGHLTATR